MGNSKFLKALSGIWNTPISEENRWKQSYTEWVSLHENDIPSWKNWLGRRAQQEDIGNMWRIHDSLYDLNSWADKHPGGKFWLELTKGTDITEAFEAHHISQIPESILPKFFVKEASKSRNSPFTFEPEGFYRTLRAKVRKKLSNVKKGPSVKSKIIADCLTAIALGLSMTAAYLENYLLCIPAGFILCLAVISAHNFFHQRDNWRMYYFNLSLMSVRDWRVSHAMSHHIYPNTLHDLEVLMFQPLFQWLPKPNKTIVARYASWIYAPFVYCFIFHLQFITRLILHPDGYSELIQLIVPAVMILTTANLLQVIIMWNIIILSASFLFGWIGINAAHHHPHLFHDGDIPREDRDWGLFQLDTVKDRTEIKGMLPLVLTLFGDHTLHHLFPTIDHALLDSLYPVLEETCTEFGYDFKLSTALDLIRGQFQQLARIKTH